MDKKTFDIIHSSLPDSKEMAWIKYPNLNWVYNTSRLLDFQEIEWYPFFIESVTNTAILNTSLYSDTIEVFNGNSIKWCQNDIEYIFLPKDIDMTTEHHKVDIIVHKGQPVKEIYYIETDEGEILDATTAPGEIELKFRSLIAWHFDKFCGVISIEYSNNMMLSVDLKANGLALPIYPPEIVKKIPALYNRRHWTK